MLIAYLYQIRFGTTLMPLIVVAVLLMLGVWAYLALGPQIAEATGRLKRGLESSAKEADDLFEKESGEDVL